MRRLQIRGIVLSFVILAANGCVPVVYIEVPAIRGRVIDSNGRPVDRAIVRVVTDQHGRMVGSVSTDCNGMFNRTEQSQLSFLIPGADPMLLAYRVVATSGERKSPAFEVYGGIRRWFLVFYDPPMDRNLGDLQLQ